MKRSTLCYELLRARRYVWLAAVMVLLLPLAFVLPGWLWMLLGGPMLMVASLALVWHVFGLGCFGAAYQRTPKPSDALAETVLVDADLIDAGLCVQAVCQPVEARTDLSLRMGSGALLLGTTMALLSDSMPAADRAAIHAALTRPALNIRPDRMKAHHPVLLREQTAEYTALTVQDGPHERVCYMGSAETLSQLCSSVWEENGPRALSREDRKRILDAASYMEQGQCRVIAFATATGDERPTFLGMCGLGHRLRMDAVQELSHMKGMGLTVMLRDVETPGIDAAELRKTLDIPNLHARADIYLSATREPPIPDTLTIRPLPEVPLSEPILRLREQFTRAESMLTLYSRLLATLLLCCLLTATPFAAIAVTAVMLCGAWCFGLPRAPRKLPIALPLLTLGGCLLLRVFLTAVMPGTALGAGAMLCTLLAFASSMMFNAAGTRPAWKQALIPAIAALLLGTAGALLATCHVLAAVLAVLWGSLMGLLSWVWLR